MPFLKNPFGKSKAEEPVRRISVSPIQTEAEQTSTRDTMEKQMASSRETRQARAPDNKPAK